MEQIYIYDHIKQFKDFVFVFDNEPYNKEIHKRMLSIIEWGYNIVIWPKGIKEKDINDMVLSNIDVNQVVRDNTYNNLEARAIFSDWRI